MLVVDEIAKAASISSSREVLCGTNVERGNDVFLGGAITNLPVVGDADSASSNFWFAVARPNLFPRGDGSGVGRVLEVSVLLLSPTESRLEVQDPILSCRSFTSSARVVAVLLDEPC